MFITFFGSGYGVDYSSIYRFRAAFYGFQLFFRRPFFGNGFDSVYANYYVMAHNNIAEIAADFGIFALIIEEFFILFPLYFVFKKNNRSLEFRPFIMSTLIFMFLFQFFLVSFNSKIECIILPLCFAMIFPYEKRYVPIDHRTINI